MGFELAGAEAGTRMILEHRQIAADEVVGFSAGWHAHLDGLEASRQDRGFDWDATFTGLKPLYEARLP